MTLISPKLLIAPPTGPISPGRGFYQLEEEALYVQVGAFMGNRHFFSYLESERLRLEFDRDGYLLFIEFDQSRRNWPVNPQFAVPEPTHAADLRWLDFRKALAEPTVTTNKRKSEICWQFTQEPAREFLRIAEHLLAGITPERTLASLWVSNIEDDLAGQEIAAFRESLRNASGTNDTSQTATSCSHY